MCCQLGMDTIFGCGLETVCPLHCRVPSAVTSQRTPSCRLIFFRSILLGGGGTSPVGLTGEAALSGSLWAHVGHLSSLSQRGCRHSFCTGAWLPGPVPESVRLGSRETGCVIQRERCMLGTGLHGAGRAAV